MNITFLVGNGFDLNIGLHTQYKDFYSYCINHNYSNSILDDIKDHPECWSDMELGLGTMLSNVSESEVESYLDDKEQIEKYLSQYLHDQEKQVEIVDDNALANELKDMISKISDDFNVKEKNLFTSYISTVNTSIRYCFINYNYTTILDRIIEITHKRYNTISQHASKNVGYNDILVRPMHLHGTVNHELVMGLDNNTQIGNKDLQEDNRLNSYIIKSNVNDNLGNERISEAEGIISSSDYVFIYGMSLGETDKRWWKYLLTWLQQSSKKRLIVYNYSSEEIDVSGQNKLRYRDRIINKIMSHLNPDELDECSSVNGQIIVVNNTKMFSFKSLKLKSNN